MLHCGRRTAMFLILGYFFVPLEDVKLRQLTRRRRLHDNAMQCCHVGLGIRALLERNADLCLAATEHLVWEPAVFAIH